MHFVRIKTKLFSLPSWMSLVKVPETSIQMAIPMVEVIISGRRLNLLSSHAFSSDIMKRVIPTNIDT